MYLNMCKLWNNESQFSVQTSLKLFSLLLSIKYSALVYFILVKERSKELIIPVGFFFHQVLVLWQLYYQILFTTDSVSHIQK